MEEKYEALKELGSGNFGVARLVKDKKTNELLAVKFIDRGKKIDENVQREIINHRSLTHPNIVRFKEVLLTPSQLAIVMEYAAGGELFAKICSAGRFSEDEARFFYQQLISGVSYCHSMEICHRDLKLENTLLDGSPTPRLKICDFGYSKRITIPEIKKHPWFLKNMPRELVEGEKTNYGEADRDKQLQSIDEIMQIIQEAKTPGETGSKAEVQLGIGNSIDGDEDVDLESDIDYSGDYASHI